MQCRRVPVARRLKECCDISNVKTCASLQSVAQMCVSVENVHAVAIKLVLA